MTTLTIEIDKEKDLPAIEAFLKQMGLEYHLDDDSDDWGDLPAEAVEGIKAGLEDIKAGRVYTHAEVMAHMEQRLSQLRKKDG